MHVSYGDLVIAIEAPAADLRWLGDFLEGPFGQASGPAARTVRMRVDAAAYARLAAGAAGDEVACFTLDGSFRSLSARPGDGGARVLHDARGRVVLVVGAGEAEVVAEAGGYPARLALLRVVREIATTHALGRGWLHVHGAAVETGGRVLAFAGPRRSGKSTLLLDALLSGGARFVANDRLFVDPAPAPPVARGMPTLVALREDAVERFGGLAARLRARGYDRRWSLEEAVAVPPADGFPPSVTPAQLCALTGASAGGGGPLGALFFPALDAVPGYGIARLPPSGAAARLRRSLLLADLPERPAAAFARAVDVPSRDRAALDALCADLAGRVPCFALRLGPDAYRKGVWGAVVQAVA